TARTSAAGAGLGLSIVAKNIERMGGTFALTSTPGRGLAAHIRMPRSMPAPKPGELPGGRKPA
ncbi:MAG: ATP-binding protein, partial [Variovorax sp.]